MEKNVSIIYRNYNENIDEKLIIKIKNFCKNTNKKFYLSNNIKVAIKLDLDGVYLPSFNKQFNPLVYKSSDLVFGGAFKK